jgi:uncharacterized protein (TIGR03086 family)
MTDWTDLLARTYDVVRTPVAQLDDTLLDRPTPCAEWTIRELFEHTIFFMDMFAASAGAPVEDGTVAGTPLERFDVAAKRNLAAWTSLADPSATLSLSFGDFPADLSAGMNQMESLVHGWDLAASLGLPFAWPADLTDAALANAKVSVPPSRGHVFGAEAPARDSSPGEKLLAFTGRDTAAWTGAIWVAGSLVTMKPTGTDPAPASAVEIWEREGSGPPRHVHAEHDEVWYVLEGRFTFALGDREFEAGAGDFVVGPRGVPHTFRAETSRSRLVDIHTPGGFERFFVRAGVPATALVPPPPAEAGSPDALRAMIEAFGATVVGPPLG